jgi:hypothetical protein
MKSFPWQPASLSYMPLYYRTAACRVRLVAPQPVQRPEDDGDVGLLGPLEMSVTVAIASIMMYRVKS